MTTETYAASRRLRYNACMTLLTIGQIRALPHTPWLDALRFLQLVEPKESGCWVWTGTTGVEGYGRFRLNTTKMAHRVAYEMFVGPVPVGLQLDHLCRRRDCVNPFHLESVTASENTKRGWQSNQWRRAKHCPHGHEFTEANTYFDPKRGHRRCRVCLAVKARDRRRRKHSALAR